MTRVARLFALAAFVAAGAKAQDVPCPGTFTSSIEQLKAENVTGRRGDGDDCPNNPNTRGQMAVSVVRTFCLR